ncbi:uncharacterized protein SOCE26_005130 [Sorangium cellulosum]|uniref:Polyprenyl synthetase n=2 Tax=Sorangium cellulosum TaxID=56 RepID=A0A2L0EIK6_SORCE|nr:uncharacterized protein SOCE26_005130 [Sorangium cellulosum]
MTTSIEGLSALRTALLDYEEVRRRYSGEVERRVMERQGAGLVHGMTAYHLASGGKRMRALLPIWVCINLGGRAEDALDLGVGLELLHNATLIHDDIQDGDSHRRGRPAVWFQWGVAQAINAGDALIFQGIERIARSPAARQFLPFLMDALTRIAEGQAMDLDLHQRPAPAVTLKAWEAMARSKTGALFAACVRAGALAAGAEADVVESATTYGEDVGLLFQVQDDYLDIVGDKGRTHRGRDLMEGKLSFPVIWALEHGSAQAVAPVRALLECAREQRTLAMVDEAVDALARCGALRATAGWIRSAAQQLEIHWMAKVLPNWGWRCLAPIAHALAADLSAS